MVKGWLALSLSSILTEVLAGMVSMLKLYESKYLPMVLLLECMTVCAPVAVSLASLESLLLPPICSLSSTEFFLASSLLCTDLSEAVLKRVGALMD